MDIVHIAAEMAPFAKVGGLADVLHGLCRELIRQGHQAEVVLPKYDCGQYDTLSNFRCTETLETSWLPVEVCRAECDGIPVVLLDPKHPHHYFNRGSFYGGEDEITRFLAFCRAAFEYLSSREQAPDAVHLHDWQTAAIAPLIRAYGTPRSQLVFTIHNIQYQGQCAPDLLNTIGLDGLYELDMNRMADNYNPNAINLMKGGIVYSDRVTTVSPSYAQEVLDPAGGRGLEATLRRYQTKFSGVLNGLDADFWNPQNDLFLSARYKTPKGKEKIKTALQQELHLSEEEKPIVAVVTRLVPQKGIELIKHAMRRTLDQGGQFIILGSSPDPMIQSDFAKLAEHHKTNPNCSINLRYDEPLAHRVFAGSDILIVPSLFEPCGLTQLIAMRYGTVPVVRETGGLADTIVDVDYGGRPFEECNGYTFRDPDFNGVDSALDRALSCWYNEKNTWSNLIKNGMKTNSSWENSSREYLALYQVSQ